MIRLCSSSARESVEFVTTSTNPLVVQKSSQAIVESLNTVSTGETASRDSAAYETEKENEEALVSAGRAV